MIRRIDLRGAAAPRDYRAALPRAEFDVEAASHEVAPIIAAVRERGVEAILEFSARFDGVEQTDIVVPKQAITDALADLDPEIRAGLEESIARLRAASENELEQDVVTDLGPGARVVHRKVPVGRVGLYVPGGLAPLVSTVLMNVVPAQVAGVGSIALTSSPQKEFGGLPHPTILAACALLGIDEVYAVGGAQAIAMFALGTGPCARVDMVTGPGNIYVVTAKRMLKGEVGIDSEAGPTEVAILADETADAAYVAADLVSEAEHDPLAAAVLITDSETLADEVEAQLDKQVASTRHAERVRTALSGSPWAEPSRRSSSSTTSTRGSGWPTPTPPSTSRSRPATPPPWPAGSATPARSSSARSLRSRSATTAPAPTTCCPRAAVPATRLGCRCAPS
jgi:histidinol dehydrogenase